MGRSPLGLAGFCATSPGRVGGLLERDRLLASDIAASAAGANDQVKTRALAGSSASDLAVTIRAAFVDISVRLRIVVGLVLTWARRWSVSSTR
jgi:hypothetical protein